MELGGSVTVQPRAARAAPTTLPAALRSDVLLVLGSFLLCSLVPTLSTSVFGDLSWNYTDHLRHAQHSWLFLHVGWDVYREPFGVVAARAPYRLPLLMWPTVAYAYPPLVLAVFLPYALAVQTLPLSAEALVRLGILQTLAFAHVGLWALLRALAPLDPARLALALVAAAMLLRCGLSGFYDPLWVACAAAMVLALGRGRPARALMWFALAALLSYRAVVLAPLAAGAAWDAVRGRPWRAWPWGALALVAGTGLACTVLFVWMLPYSEGNRQAATVLARGGVPLGVTVLASALAVAAALRWADRAVAATVALTSAFALVDTHGWWHALVLLVAPLAVGAWRPARRPRRVTGVLLLWLLALHQHAWGGPPYRLLQELDRFSDRVGEPPRLGRWRSLHSYRGKPWQPRLYAPSSVLGTRDAFAEPDGTTAP